MRYDIRHPEKRFSDRFVLGAGHTIPLIYCTLAILNESLRARHEKTGDPRFLVHRAESRARSIGKICSVFVVGAVFPAMSKLQERASFSKQTPVRPATERRRRPASHSRSGAREPPEFAFSLSMVKGGSLPEPLTKL